MKPIRTFLYLLVTIALFVTAMYFLSEQKLELPIVQEIPESIVEDTVEFIEIKDTIQEISPDSIVQTTPGQTELQNGFHFFGDKTILHPFFDKLTNLQAYKAPLRILYFGDSQVENDRITATIREKFQQKIGGKGIGLLPLGLVYNLSHQFSVELSDNWQQYSIHDAKKEKPVSSLIFNDTYLNGKQEAWFKVKQIKRRAEEDYSRLKLFYRAKGEFIVIIKEGGQLIYKGRIAKSEKQKALNFSFNSTPESAEIYFETTDTLVVSGISLESMSGVLVDNIALRGYSYPTFTRLDEPRIKEAIQLINPGLCVFQFGVNLAPYYQKEYSYYQKQLMRQIRKFQFLMPDVPVLIVGISDMAKKEDGKMVSYSNIKTIKKAQIEAAKECNCAFWDLEEFMGGKGSMIEWVNKKPRLGQKDYIHFTEEGTKLIGNKISDLLLNEYENYLKTKPVE